MLGPSSGGPAEVSAGADFDRAHLEAALQRFKVLGEVFGQYFRISIGMRREQTFNRLTKFGVG